MISLADIDNMPQDPDALKAVIREVVFANKKLSEENAWFREILAAQNRRLFGRKSEKIEWEEAQYWLFNEAEMGASGQKKADKETQTITYTRKKRGRKPISDRLPRKEVIHDLPESEKRCGCCGKERPRLSSEVVEKVGYIPAMAFVNRHVYPKYGPCSCRESKALEAAPIVSAPHEKAIIPGGMAEPSLLAYLITSKFCDGLPFYRQEKILARHGVDYSRATMCNQMIGLSRAFAPLLDLMWKDLLSSTYISLDETRLQVLKESGRDADRKSWMHVAVGYYEGKKIILFHYHRNRTKDIPMKILEGWSGYLQTDGLAAYNGAGAQPGVVRVGCWSHARRKFIDARGGPKAPPGGLADEALQLIGKLFAIETAMRDKYPEDEESFLRERRRLVEPVFADMRFWLDEYTPKVPPKSMLGEAVVYVNNQWETLIRYIDHAKIRPDNNIVENAIRPFVIGRKNWLFSDTSLGAHASATIYTFTESAKANGLEPYSYFLYLITVLPTTPPESLIDLLPHRIDPKLLESGKSMDGVK